jgi:NAD-dependent DNA ligase
MHEQRLIQRDIDQLLGVCEFALQDGHIDQGEAAAILAWLNNHSACLDAWPASILYDRLSKMLADDVLDDDEQGELLGLVMSIVKPPIEAARSPATLPLTAPAPAVQLLGKTFCFTGVFDFGSRADCHAAIEDLGGIPAKSITKKLDYLVIGNVGSDCWRHSSFGTKIIKAVEYRDAGAPLAIVSENHWIEHLS